MSKAKHIEDIETEKVQLSVFECECGFHIGLDFTFMDQVDKGRDVMVEKADAHQ